MIKIKKTSISLTRGDSAYINFTLTDINGEPLQLAAGDRVRCQVRKEPVTGELLFDGEVTYSQQGNQITWHIHPSDTANAQIGTYYWDAQVEYANGDIYTFVDVSEFTLLPEVTLIE